jgi:hypothetical protein
MDIIIHFQGPLFFPREGDVLERPECNQRPKLNSTVRQPLVSRDTVDSKKINGAPESP